MVYYDSYRERFIELKKAVENLYYAGHWKSDRCTEHREKELWEKVRDAAGFEHGYAPKENK